MKKHSDLLRRAAALLAALLLAGACPGGAVGENSVFPPLEAEIPETYLQETLPEGGCMERITYSTRDYLNNGREITKPALVYLPADYSEDRPCEVLVLLHGIGGSEQEWGFGRAAGAGRSLTDHLFADGYVKDLIIVMPNGRSSWNYFETSRMDPAPFYAFGEELRNDLLPYIDEHYNTIADREHRAIAGLSMGGIQTLDIGLCECLDLFSAFGVFSAASGTASRLAARMDTFPEEDTVRCFYCICGRGDSGIFTSASVLGKNVPQNSRVSAERWLWQECSGGHDFSVWNLGLYNFLRLLGSLQE